MANIFSLSELVEGLCGRNTKQVSAPVPVPQSAPVSVKVDEDPVTAIIDKHVREAAADAAACLAVSPDPIRVAARGNAIEGDLRRVYKGPLTGEEASDNNLFDRFLKAEEDVRLATDDLKRASIATDIAQRDEPPPEPPPPVSIPVLFFAIIGFALAFGSSIFELPPLRAIEEDLLRLVISGAIGACLGGLCVTSMWGLKAYHEKATATWWAPEEHNPAWAMLAGLLFAAAFAAIRLSVSTTPGDYLVTLGLAGLDVGVLMYAKTEATRHRLSEDVWTKRNDNRLQKVRITELEMSGKNAAQIVLNNALAQLQKVEKERAARMRLDFPLDITIQSARSAVYQAYLSAIDHNLGRGAAGKAAL